MTVPSEGDANKPSSARDRLSDLSDRPFEAQEILSQAHAKKEREREVEREIAERLENEHRRARERGNVLRARKVETEAKKLRDRTEELEAQARRFQGQVKKAVIPQKKPPMPEKP